LTNHQLAYLLGFVIISRYYFNSKIEYFLIEGVLIMNKLALIFICLFSSVAFAGPKEEATLVVERWMQAFTASDVNTIVGLYSPDAVFLGTGSKTIVTQQEGVKKYFESNLGSGRKFVATLVDSSVVEVNDSTVVVTGLDKLTVTLGGRPVDLLGRVTFVLSKKEAGWKIINFHRSAMPE
jgi:uncharacterized protein (TIGR02246 family)